MNAMPLGLVLAAALFIAPEQPIPWSNDEPRYASVESLRIATDGEGYLVAWDGGTDGLHFRHIDVEGRLGEETIFPGPEWLEPLEIVSTGSGYFAMVAQRFSDRAPFLLRFDSKGRQIGDRGAPLFHYGFPRFWTGAMAWNGARALIATDLGNALLVDGNGTVFLRDLRFFGPHYFSDEIERLTAASAGSGFLLFHDGPGGLYSRYVAGDGAMPHPSALIEAHGKGPIAIVSTGDAYVLFWSSNGVLLAQRADVEGRPLGPVKELARFASIVNIAAAWTGTEVVAYAGAAEQAEGPIALHKIRLAPDLTPLAPGTVRVAEQWVSRMEVAASSRGALASWVASGACTFLDKVMVRRIDDPAAPEILLTPGAPRQKEPAVAFASGVTATAYLEQRDTLRVRVAFLPSGKDVVLSAVAGMSAPAIASNGTSFLAAWLDAESSRSCERVAVAAALSIHGELLAPPVRLGAAFAAENPPAAVWTGSEYTVFWEARDPNRVVGARVAAGGTRIDAAPVPIGPAERAMMINAASTGSETWVAWSPNAVQTNARRITRELQPIGEPFVLAPERGGIVAFNGRGGIAVWGSTIAYGRTISADGTLGPARQLGDFPSLSLRSSAIWDGSRYVVARAGTLIGVDPNLAVVDVQRLASPAAMAIGYAPSGIAVAYETANGILVRPGAMVRTRAVR